MLLHYTQRPAGGAGRGEVAELQTSFFCLFISVGELQYLCVGLRCQGCSVCNKWYILLCTVTFFFNSKNCTSIFVRRFTKNK